MDDTNSELTGLAVRVLSRCIQKDPDLAWAWHCNIAVMMQDEGVSHAVSNRGAARFMKLAFGVDTSKAPIPVNDEEDVEIPIIDDEDVVGR